MVEMSLYKKPSSANMFNLPALERVREHKSETTEDRELTGRRSDGTAIKDNTPTTINDIIGKTF